MLGPLLVVSLLRPQLPAEQVYPVHNPPERQAESSSNTIAFRSALVPSKQAAPAVGLSLSFSTANGSALLDPFAALSRGLRCELSVGPATLLNDALSYDWLPERLQCVELRPLSDQERHPRLRSDPSMLGLHDPFARSHNKKRRYSKRKPTTVKELRTPSERRRASPDPRPLATAAVATTALADPFELQRPRPTRRRSTLLGLRDPF